MHFGKYDETLHFNTYKVNMSKSIVGAVPKIEDFKSHCFLHSVLVFLLGSMGEAKPHYSAIFSSF